MVAVTVFAALYVIALILVGRRSRRLGDSPRDSAVVDVADAGADVQGKVIGVGVGGQHLVRTNSGRNLLVNTTTDGVASGPGGGVAGARTASLSALASRHRDHVSDVGSPTGLAADSSEDPEVVGQRTAAVAPGKVSVDNVRIVGKDSHAR